MKLTDAQIRSVIAGHDATGNPHPIDQTNADALLAHVLATPRDLPETGSGTATGTDSQGGSSMSNETGTSTLERTPLLTVVDGDPSDVSAITADSTHHAARATCAGGWRWRRPPR